MRWNLTAFIFHSHISMGESKLGFNCKITNLAAARLLLNRALLCGALLGLSACVSSVSPTALQIEPQPAAINENPDPLVQANYADNVKQQLL